MNAFSSFGCNLSQRDKTPKIDVSHGKARAMLGLVLSCRLSQKYLVSTVRLQVKWRATILFLVCPYFLLSILLHYVAIEGSANLCKTSCNQQNR